MISIINKYEGKTKQVLCLSLHPTRPWVLIGLLNGQIQMWDYLLGLLIHTFTEPTGPVRSIDIHSTQPIFVCGGDDELIRVFNYKEKKELFTLAGHIDYVRMVQFHNEHPWLISCSDDQSIRIWNWISRNCISILSGHDHYVMSASFHPTRDLVLTSSLDKTIRVWDCSPLKRKNLSVMSGGGTGGSGLGSFGMIGRSRRKKNNSTAMSDMLFGSSDVVVNFILDDHQRSVNCATFHPQSPMIVSGSEDKSIKVWRTSETKAWLIETLYGHSKAIISTIFDPRNNDRILSTAEDGSLKIWSIQKRKAIKTIKSSTKKFTQIVAHPTLNLFAAGHSNGFVVFKLEKERPAFTVENNNIFYYKDEKIRLYNIKDNADLAIMPFSPMSKYPLETIAYQPQVKCFLICDQKEYEIWKISSNNTSTKIKSGQGHYGIFIDKNRFAVLDKNCHILLKNLNDNKIKRIKPINDVFTKLFYGGRGHLLLSNSQEIALFDLQQRRFIKRLEMSNLYSVNWSKKNNFIAFWSKHRVIITDRNLKKLCQIHETIKIKSLRWSSHNVVFYSTQNHLKYLLLNGENGVFKTLEKPVYLAIVLENSVFYINREKKIDVLGIQSNELKLKLALNSGENEKIIELVQKSKFPGFSMIKYLKEKGYPEIALYLVKDPQTRFDLALESNDLDEAFEMAKKIDKKENWERLAELALLNGKIEIVEKSYQRAKNFDKLSFLYLVTGNTNNLTKMLSISERRNDIDSIFQNSIYLKNVPQMAKLLIETGKNHLALELLKNHGLNNIIEENKSSFENLNPDNSEEKKNDKGNENKIINKNKDENDNNNKNIEKKEQQKKLIFPQIPLNNSNMDWPQLRITKRFHFNKKLKKNSKVTKYNDEEINEAKGAWGEQEDLINFDDIGNELGIQVNKDDEESTINGTFEADENGDGWSVGLDLDELIGNQQGGNDDNTNKNNNNNDEKIFIAPNPGKSYQEKVVEISEIPAELISVGAFDLAMKFLNNQIGVINFKPLKEYFLQIFITSNCSLNNFPNLNQLNTQLTNNKSNHTRNSKVPRPLVSIQLDQLLDIDLKKAYQLSTSGKFQGSLDKFLEIIKKIPFLVVHSKDNFYKVKELIGICREYITGISMELERRKIEETKKNLKKSLEMSAYFTHCNLEPNHLALSLRSAMMRSVKLGNNQNGISFAKRLIEIGASQKFGEQARKVIAYCKKNLANKIQIDYDERNPFVICCYSYTAIYKGSKSIQCPFCNAHYLPKYNKKLCNVCKLAQIGKQTSGLNITSQRIK
ncbi:coatomer subunit alpha [Anaeramoeba flamelloides]|uniref:Coatomer subunit alpha n=1 Tax=Anaeramoeba flamelloides TaxID=1746091 RepID=A0ABQ8Y7M2_9EUKA|nr:coatomer subunit alpha [Anaeramoeba flamelloides]